MAKLPAAFTTDGEEMSEFSCIPAGKYVAQIVKSSLEMTKAAKAANNPELGQRLNMQLEILQGPCKGRIVFTAPNIVNPNVTTVDIAEKEMTSIGLACGLKVFEDSDELHGIPMLIEVGIKKDKNGVYSDQNVIRNYASAEGVDVSAVEAPAAAVAAVAGTPAAATRKKRIWEQ